MTPSCARVWATTLPVVPWHDERIESIFGYHLDAANVQSHCQTSSGPGTSLSPVLGAVAVNQFARNEPWTSWFPWIASGAGCVLVCWLMLTLAEKDNDNAGWRPRSRAPTKGNDSFLTYLLPFIASDKLDSPAVAMDIPCRDAGATGNESNNRFPPQPSGQTTRRRRWASRRSGRGRSRR